MHVPALIPKFKKLEPPMRIVRFEAQSVGLDKSEWIESDGFGERARRLAAAAPDRLAIYPVKRRFTAASRIQQVSAIAGMLSIPLMACYWPLWPIAAIALGTWLGAGHYYSTNEEELLRRPIVRAARQQEKNGCPVRNQPVATHEAGAVTQVLRPWQRGCRSGSAAFGGGTSHGASALAEASASLPFDIEPSLPALLGAQHDSLAAVDTLSSQLRQTLSYVEDQADPLQIRAAIKRAAGVAWKGQLFRRQPACISLAGVVFRHKRLYAFNMGSNRVLLCKPQGHIRLTVDHSLPDAAEIQKRHSCRTTRMTEANLSRSAEMSDEPNVEKQSPQVTSIKLREAKGGTVVIVNAAVSAVLSDQIINAYVIQQAALGIPAQELADQLLKIAAHRHLQLGNDIYSSKFAPGIVIVRPPNPGCPSLRADPSQPHLRPARGVIPPAKYQWRF